GDKRLLDGVLGLVHSGLGLYKRAIVGLALRVVELVVVALAGRIAGFRVDRVVAAVLDTVPVILGLGVAGLRLCQRVGGLLNLGVGHGLGLREPVAGRLQVG